jgi:hypothetical protein
VVILQISERLIRAAATYLTSSLRILDMVDSSGRGAIDLDYDLDAAGEIEIPKCLAGV